MSTAPETRPPTPTTEPPAPEPVAPGTAEAAAALEELEDRWRRAVAELDNLRKRFERQLADQLRVERVRVAGAFLPVLDNLELALRHAEADPATIVAGVQAVRDQALAVLAGLGYRRLDEVGVRFDPARHEAAQVVAADNAESGSVVAVLRPGYTDHDGALLRPATVTVAGQPPAGTGEEQAGAE
jgi:molecular chaperone GrpE